MTNAAATDRDAIVPRSVRYRLSRDQAAAALQVIGAQPDGRLLAPLEPAAEPVDVLRAAGLLDEGGGLPPFLADSMLVAAAPRRTVHAITTVPGSPDWVDVLIGAAAESGPYVTVGVTVGEGAGVDVYALETAMEVAAVFDDLFRLTAYPTRPVDPDVIMTFPAWVGLLAVADVRRLRRLRNDLRRRVERPEPITVTDVEGAISVGIASDDSRWAVSSALPVAPIPLRERPSDAASAVRALVDLGVLEGADEYVVTPFGDHLVELIASTVLLGSVTLTHRRPQTEVRGGEVLVYRTPTRLAMGIWSGAAAEPVLILTEPTPEAAVAMMRRLVELPNAGDDVIAGTDEPATVAPAPPPFDPTHVVGPGGCAATSAPGGPETGTLAGGVPVRVLAREGEWAEIVVESGQHSWVPASGLVTPGGPTASPTHRVGEGGAPGWERPDPTAPASVQLDAGAHVVVVEESGVWARIRTEDGWEGWVDGRLLRSA